MQRCADHIRVLASIDDTDNHESRGTGHRARLLGRMLSDDGLADVRGISRHQLFVHPDIPYTSHNSSLCLDLVWRGGDLALLRDITADFLARSSAPGSDAGFAIARFDAVPEAVVTFGLQAKSVVLKQADARDLAKQAGIVLEGVTGDEGGVIGALAAVGLRKGANDGRFVWVEGVRELRGIVSARDLLEGTGIDRLQASCAGVVESEARISVDPWPRPILKDDQAILLIEKVESEHADSDWRLVPREVTKQY